MFFTLSLFYLWLRRSCLKKIDVQVAPCFDTLHTCFGDNIILKRRLKNPTQRRSPAPLVWLVCVRRPYYWRRVKPSSKLLCRRNKGASAEDWYSTPTISRFPESFLEERMKVVIDQTYQPTVLLYELDLNFRFFGCLKKIWDDSFQAFKSYPFTSFPDGQTHRNFALVHKYCRMSIVAQLVPQFTGTGDLFIGNHFRWWKWFPSAKNRPDWLIGSIHRTLPYSIDPASPTRPTGLASPEPANSTWQNRWTRLDQSDWMVRLTRAATSVRYILIIPTKQIDPNELLTDSPWAEHLDRAKG